MRIGYARVSKADGSQSLDLQREAQRAEGIGEPANLGTSAWTVGSERVVFLGVLAAVLYRELAGSLEFRDVPTATQVVPVNKEMIGLGVAHKAVTVVETIEAEVRRFGQM